MTHKKLYHYSEPEQDLAMFIMNPNSLFEKKTVDGSENIFRNEQKTDDSASASNKDFHNSSKALPLKLKPIPAISAHDFPFDFEEIHRNFSLWHARRLLILRCEYAPLSRYLAYQLTQNTEAESKEKKQVHILDATKQDIGQIDLVDSLEASPELAGNTLLSWAVTTPSLHLFTPIFFQPERMLDVLEKQNLWLLVCITETEYEKIKQYRPGEALPSDLIFWNVDYTKTLLESKYPLDFQRLYESLQKQRKFGYWGEPKEFHAYFLRTYSDPERDLKDQIESNEEVADYSIKRNDRINDDAFKKAGSLLERGEFERIILFVAAFFSDLSFESFCKTTATIFPNEFKTINETKIVLTKKNKEKVINKSTKISYRDYWEKNLDQIRIALGLEIMDKPEGGEKIVFSEPRTPVRLRGLFLQEYRYFLNQTLCRLFDNQVYLELCRDEITRECILELIITMSQKNPSFFLQERVIKIIQDIYDITTTLLQSNQDEDLKKVTLALHHLSWRQKSTFIVDLIIKLNASDTLSDSVYTFFENLISKEKCFELIDLIFHLNQVSAPIYLDWLTRIHKIAVEKKNVKLEEKVFSTLSAITNMNSYVFGQVLRHFLQQATAEPSKQDQDHLAFNFYLWILLPELKNQTSNRQGFLTSAAAEPHFEVFPETLFEFLFDPRLDVFFSRYQNSFLPCCFSNFYIRQFVPGEAYNRATSPFWTNLVNQVAKNLTFRNLEHLPFGTLLFASQLIFRWWVAFICKEDGEDGRRRFSYFRQALTTKFTQHKDVGQGVILVWRAMLPQMQRQFMFFYDLIQPQLGKTDPARLISHTIREERNCLVSLIKDFEPTVQKPKKRRERA